MPTEMSGSFVSPTSIAVELSLRRAMRKREQALHGLEPDAIHDIRVALRRCRSLAEGFANLDPHPAWRKLLRVCKKQQRGLADLRDVQVMRGWLKELGLASGPAGRGMAVVLDQDEAAGHKRAEATLQDFPRKRFKRWLKRLPLRAQIVPANEARWAEIALARLASVRHLDRNWHRTHTMSAWHRLRVAVKRFRYVVDSFLPVQHRHWENDLKRLQDLLGEGHDLDVLRAKIVAAAAQRRIAKRAANAALRRIDREVSERVKAYEQAILIVGVAEPSGKRAGPRRLTSETVWNVWRAELAKVAGVTSQGAAAAAPSSASPARPGAARSHRSPGTRRRIS